MSLSPVDQLYQEASGSALPQEEDEKSKDNGTSKRRRNRKPVTCLQCRKRKLKCDRGAPCGACRERNEPELCEWEGAIRLPQANYPRDSDGLELRSQLDRLEGLLEGLQVTQRPARPSLPNRQSSNSISYQSRAGIRTTNFDNDRTSAAEALGLLAGTSNSSAPGSSAHDSSQGYPLLFPLGTSITPTLKQLITLLPPTHELNLLLQDFLSDLSFLPIVHAPTFKERHRHFDPSSTRNDPFYIAFLLAIAGWQTFWRSSDPRISRMESGGDISGGRNYLQAALDALHLAGYLEIYSIDGLCTLLLLHRYYTEQDSASATAILDIAIRTAQGLGLNRDPSPYQRFKSVEAEDRRRLWAILVSHDWIDSPGRMYSCSPSQYDTLLPSNARDQDITDSGVISSSLSIPTPVLYTVYKAQIASVARQITDRAFGIQSAPSWATVVELNAELSQLDGSLPASFAFEWENGAVKRLPAEISTIDFTRIHTHLLLRHQFIRLHRPFLTRGKADPRFGFSREKCCWAARYILAIHRGLGDDFRATRSWSIVFHTLNALVILAVDLCQDPRGSYSQIHRADVAASIQLLEARPDKSPLLIETIRVVVILLRHVLPSDTQHKRKYEETESRPATSNSIFRHDVNRASPPSPPRRPFDPNLPFSRPLPLPISADPFAPPTSYAASTSSNPEMEFAQLWNGLGSYRKFYAVPDVEEWQQVVARGAGAWSAGIDLLQ